ncbi:hypothetical protein INT44_008812 [Umbelopsis vinacea]|uniref:Nonsense-mediated mRNA decay factor SMG8 n=1 Tax=Umbelopsis vinacea TaxID=44442 RepID=A0A8H7PGK3_9FUNG|nr:hypothetical protein INT44_008812 [Umbelopsis vinacea]
MTEVVGMHHIHSLLSRAGVPPNTTSLSIVSLIGCKDRGASTQKGQQAFLDAANSVVGESAFSSSIVLSENLQMYYNKSRSTLYILLDTTVDYDKLKQFAEMLKADPQPILPSSMMSTDLPATLSTLASAKQSINTHMTQLLIACWRKWDIAIPNGLVERKEGKREKERDAPVKTASWWGPGKSVPSMVLVGMNIVAHNQDNTHDSSLAASVKKLQDSTQARIKYMLRAMHLISSSPDGGSSVTPGNENRTLFTVPSASTQSFVFIIPSSGHLERRHKTMREQNNFQPVELESFLSMLDVETSTNAATKHQKKSHEENLIAEYNGKLLRNFVSNALKSAVHAAGRSPAAINAAANLTSKRSVKTELPTAIQVFSALAIGRNVLIEQFYEDEFRTSMVTDSPGAKGIIQQVEAALRKRIDLLMDVDNVYSKSKELPPYYTEKYHYLKRDIALSMYELFAQGPCYNEYKTRLLDECDTCGHEHQKVDHQDTIEDDQDGDAGGKISSSAHNSGYRPLHACNCGKSQRIREDPFTLQSANIGFFQSFTCCSSEPNQDIPVTTANEGTISNPSEQKGFTTLTRLGNAKAYKHHVGLEGYEGFTAAAKFLLPWDIQLKNESMDAGKMKSLLPATNQGAAGTNERSPPSQAMDETNWPALGQAPKVTTPAQTMVVPSYDMFPALGTAARQAEVSDRPIAKPKLESTTVVPAVIPAQTENKREGRRRRRGDKAVGQSNKMVHCYLHLEYECPLGHRFMSYGDGKVFKHGHAKQESAKRLFQQDPQIYILCPCNYTGEQRNNKPSITAQLQRIWLVIPEAPGSVKMNIVCRFQDITTGDSYTYTAFSEPQKIPANGMFVLRLPYIYTDSTNNEQIPISLDAETRTKCARMDRDFVQYIEPS